VARRKKRKRSSSSSSPAARTARPPPRRSPSQSRKISTRGGFDQHVVLPEDLAVREALARMSTDKPQIYVPPVNPAVEQFLANNFVEGHAAARLRALPMELQNAIIANSFAGARDPTAVLIGRIRKYAGWVPAERFPQRGMLQGPPGMPLAAPLTGVFPPVQPAQPVQQAQQAQKEDVTQRTQLAAAEVEKTLFDKGTASMRSAIAQNDGGRNSRISGFNEERQSRQDGGWQQQAHDGGRQQSEGGDGDIRDNSRGSGGSLRRLLWGGDNKRDSKRNPRESGAAGSGGGDLDSTSANDPWEDQPPGLKEYRSKMQSSIADLTEKLLGRQTLEPRGEEQKTPMGPGANGEWPAMDDSEAWESFWNGQSSSDAGYDKPPSKESKSDSQKTSFVFSRPFSSKARSLAFKEEEKTQAPIHPVLLKPPAPDGPSTPAPAPAQEPPPLPKAAETAKPENEADNSIPSGGTGPGQGSGNVPMGGTIGLPPGEIRMGGTIPAMPENVSDSGDQLGLPPLPPLPPIPPPKETEEGGFPPTEAPPPDLIPAGIRARMKKGTNVGLQGAVPPGLAAILLKQQQEQNAAPPMPTVTELTEEQKLELQLAAQEAEYQKRWVQHQMQAHMALFETQQQLGYGQEQQSGPKKGDGKGDGETGGFKGRRRSSQPMLPGDWECPSCGDHQFSRNWTCRACGALRPD